MGAPSLFPALLMEFIGTFFLCLTVAGAAKFSELAPLAIGGVLMCMIYAGAHVSGANYNPAVSFALALTGNLPWLSFVWYSVVQIGAGVCAGITGAAMIADTEIGHPAVGSDFNAANAAIAEFAFTFALAFVVLNVATVKANGGNQFFGLAIGFTVTAGACAGGPVSGGAFNPAVGIGLPLMAADTSFCVPIYMIFPMLGAAAAAGAFYLTNPGEFGSRTGELAELVPDKQAKVDDAL